MRRSMVSILTSQGQQHITLSVLQVAEGMVLVPDIAIAEVVGWQRNIGDTFTWRDQVVSCLDLTDSQERACVVVCHALYRPENVFYALAVSGLPKMLRVNEDEIHDLDAKLVYPWQRGWVQVKTQTNQLAADRFILPDIEKLENTLP